MKNLYGVMVKYPEPGKVKTRLAKDVGEERAAEVYKRLVEKIMRNTVSPGNDFGRIIFYDPPERLRDFETWFPGERFVEQRGSDVGERMDNVIRALLRMGSQKAVITGADIPELSSAIIMEAFTALDSADIVIGPAKDGGYYLIGMKSPHPDIFRNIPWSTGSVFEETMKSIEKLQLSCNTITTLSDLDSADDYERMFG